MSSDLTAARVLSDQEIRDAIEELNRSTQAITHHTETLKLQQEALGRLVDAAHQSSEERGAMEAGQARKWHAQRRDLASSVCTAECRLVTSAWACIDAQQASELSQTLSSRITELEQQTTGAGATIQQTVDTLFRSDDKLLSSLQKLGWELETEDASEQQDVAVLRETCARLIKFTVEGIRTKLDRLFLESLELSAQSGAANRVSSGEVSALQEELESLYAEILPVAQMSTEQQFLEPALKGLAAKNGRGLARSAQATSYVSAGNMYRPFPADITDPRVPGLPYRPCPGLDGSTRCLSGIPTCRRFRPRDCQVRTRHSSHGSARCVSYTAAAWQAGRSHVSSPSQAPAAVAVFDWCLRDRRRAAARGASAHARYQPPPG